MQQVALFTFIKDCLLKKGITEVVSYEKEDQSYPYIYVDIQNWTVDHPTFPRLASAGVQVHLLSQYKGSKEISTLRTAVVDALEGSAQMILVEQSSIAHANKSIRQMVLSFQAILRRNQ